MFFLKVLVVLVVYCDLMLCVNAIVCGAAMISLLLLVTPHLRGRAERYEVVWHGIE